MKIIFKSILVLIVLNFSNFALADDSRLINAVEYLKNENCIDKLKKIIRYQTLCGVAGSGITYAGKKIFKRSRLGINSLKASKGLIKFAGLSGIVSVLLEAVFPDEVAAGEHVSEYYLTPEGFKEFLKLDKDSMLYHARRDEDLTKGIISFVEEAKKLN